LLSCSKPGSEVWEGRAFPAAIITGLDQDDSNTQDFRGKVLVFHIWATWCPPCRRELPGLDRLSRSLDPEQFVVVGLTIDKDANLAREFLLKHDIRFTNYIDVDQVVASDVLGARYYPETFVVAPDGTVVRHFIGEQEWENDAIRQMLKNADTRNEGKNKR
jgi:thiol-disulfide isomerase/thioredoxin